MTRCRWPNATDQTKEQHDQLQREARSSEDECGFEDSSRVHHNSLAAEVPHGGTNLCPRIFYETFRKQLNFQVCKRIS